MHFHPNLSSSEHKFSSYLLYLVFFCSKAYFHNLFFIRLKVTSCSSSTWMTLFFMAVTPSCCLLLFASYNHILQWKTWGPLIFFPWPVVHHDKDGLFLSQQRYATSILQHTNMVAARAHPTPLKSISFMAWVVLQLIPTTITALLVHFSTSH